MKGFDMNQPMPPYYPQAPYHAAPKKKRGGKVIAAVVATVALMVGVGIGAAGNASSSTTPSKAETKTLTEEVEVVPDACVTAVESGDDFRKLTIRSNRLFMEFAEVSADAIMAAGTFDVVGMDAATVQINDITRRIEKMTPRATEVTTTYLDAAEECLGTAGQAS